MKRLLALLLVLAATLCWQPGAFAQDENSAGARQSRVRDWNAFKDEFHQRREKAVPDWNNSSWPHSPSDAEIVGAVSAFHAKFSGTIEGAPFGFYEPGMSPIRYASARYSRIDLDDKGILKYHDPSGARTAMVLLVNVVRTRASREPGDAMEPLGPPAMFAWVLGYDQAKGGWTFCENGGPDCTGSNVGGSNHFLIGVPRGIEEDALLRQFTDDMAAHGYVEGLGGGMALPAGGPNWSAPPVGFAGIGNVPGPATLGQAAAGLAIPAAVIILVNTLAGFPGGGAPSPVPQPLVPPQPLPIDEAAERRARMLKEAEDDLRRVREHKAFIAATAAGTRQGGYDAASHDRELQDLTRRERELERAIASGGGDASYVATKRDAVQVGAGFAEANRIAREFAHEQALAAARAKMQAQLEKLEQQRAQTAADYVKDVSEGFWQNTVKDVDAISGQLHDAAKAGMDTIRDVVRETGKALADPANWSAALKGTLEAIRDLVSHPIESAGKVGDFYVGIGKAAAKAAHHVATHPVETIKSVAGVDNWEKAFDPDVPVTERMARVLVGVFDAAAAVVGIKQAATAGKAAIRGVLADGIDEAALASSKLRDAARQKQIGAGQYKVFEDQKISVAGSDGLYAGSKDGLMAGVTEKSHRQITNVCQRHNVKIDVRPTTKYSHDLIAQGKAVPKAEHCKSKTINPIDVQLGASDRNLGLAGHFEPKLPPQGPMSDKDYGKLVDRYNQRVEEFADQERHYSTPAYKKKCYVEDGVVYDAKTRLPYTGDHDVLEIRDAYSGKPLPRYVIREDGSIVYDWNGRPLLNPERERIVRELNSAGVEHGAHLDWDYSNLSHAAGNASKSEYEIARGIDRGVLSRHTQDGGEPLITFGPEGPPVGSWFVGKR